MIWKNLPIVQLEEIINNRDFFKNLDVETKTDSNEVNFNAGHTKGATELEVRLEYKEQDIKVRVRYAQSTYDGVTYDVFKMKPIFPEVEKWKNFEPESRYDWKAINKLKKVVKEQQKLIDDSAEEKQKKAEVAAAWKARNDLMGTTLGVGLKTRNVGYDQGTYHEYNMSQSFGMIFSEVRTFDGEQWSEDFTKNYFNIYSLEGAFTFEQVQTLVNFLNSCPQAIADRLLKGK